MPRQVPTQPFGLAPVPGGRLKEAEASIPADLRPRVAWVHGRGIGDGSRLMEWPCRVDMARSIRQLQAKNARHAEPIIPLEDNEGYLKAWQAAHIKATNPAAWTRLNAGPMPRMGA